ncbi:pseudouridylate synthase 7 homolog [Rhagoletis pomonella]|uniref:pseudouridylate synthase 7 homolog n=1 Tax=Rhagoletis pomonella TaxID=28610 RepID=UPI0017828AC9|nr:pseudouridylate synthase 7 homolog [Rhagoletis pomonella]
MGKNRTPFKRQRWRPQQRGTPSSNSNKNIDYGNRRIEVGGAGWQSLREDQAGITEYVNKIAGFTGVVKSRFSDFQVNEIDANGKVLQITDLTTPQALVETLDETELAAARERFKEVITTEVWEKIGVLAAMKANNPAAQPIDINVSSLDKEKRTQVHNILKQLYGQKLVSSTISPTDSTDERFVRIMKPKGKPSEKRKRWTFPGEYVHFLVYKENMETTEAASRLASRLSMHPSHVNYCGTKDKRAKTTQKFCIKRREPSQILTAAKVSKIKVGNFEFSNEVVKLGDLQGNRFRIALRHVNGDEKEIEKALEGLRENGFINYFGLQRFGNHPDIPTYEIGVALLKSDYKTVAELILKPREHDLPFMDNIRRRWWEERNSAAAAANLNSNDSIEKKLLVGLATYGENDYSAALRKIPRNMLLLYTHAFQSLVFNRIASRRIREFGLKLIPGDLVYRNKEEMDDDIVEETILEDMVENEEGNEAKEENVPIPNSNEKNEAATDEAAGSKFKRKVKALSAGEIECGGYTIFDIVLPLPGYDITYPDNEVKTWYEEILEEYGLSSETLRHSVKTYALAGAYRKLLIHPRGLTWKFRKYSSAEESLIVSDWDVVTGRYEPIQEDCEVGDFKALLLDFCLPRSAYATMFLRELLKSDTSAAHQMKIELDEQNKNKNSEQSRVNEDGGEEEILCDASDQDSSQKRKCESEKSEEVEEKKSKSDG